MGISMDHSAYIHRACVDFIQIEVVFERPTQASHVSRIFKRPPHLSVSGVDPQTGMPFAVARSNTNTTTFRVRLQDPSSYQYVLSWIEKFKQRALAWDGPAVVEMERVTAIEIAFDLYARANKASRSDLAQAVVYLYRGAHTIQGQSNHRLYRDWKGSGQGIPTNIGRFVALVNKGYNVGIGNSDDDYYQHAYIKDTDSLIDPDTGKSRRRDLAPEDHRARFECRWSGEGLKTTFGPRIVDLKVFNFSGLKREFFSFRIEKSGLKGLEKEVLDATRQFGEVKPEGRPKQYRSNGLKRKISLVHHRDTKADVTLNKHVGNALRRLTEKWSGG